MRDLIIDMADFGGVASAGDEVVLSAPAVRGSSVDPGRLITPQPRTLELVDGVVTVPVEVGPLRGTLKPRGGVLPGTTFKTVVPEGEGPITLRDCLEGQFLYDPPVVNRGLDLIEGARDEALGQVSDAVGVAVAGEIGQAVMQATTSAVSAEQSAVRAETKVNAYTPRVEALELMGGLVPGEPVDGQTANLVLQGDTLTGKAIRDVVIDKANETVATPLAPLFLDPIPFGVQSGVPVNLRAGLSPQHGPGGGWIEEMSVPVVGDAGTKTLTSSDTATVGGFVTQRWQAAVTSGDRNFYVEVVGTAPGGIIHLRDPLPVSVDGYLSARYDAASGQHLTRRGTRAYVESLLGISPVISARGAILDGAWTDQPTRIQDLWRKNPALESAGVYEVTEGGRMVVGEMSTNVLNSYDPDHGTPYILGTQSHVSVGLGAAGQGLVADFDPAGRAVVLEFAVGCRRRTYAPESFKARIVVTADGVPILDVQDSGALRVHQIPITGVDHVNVEVTSASPIPHLISVSETTMRVSGQDSPPPGRGKIVTLGDSWMAWYDGAFGKALAEKTGATVINHSLGGMTTEWGLAWWDEYVTKEKPDEVWIHFYTNDFNSLRDHTFVAPDGSTRPMWTGTNQDGSTNRIWRRNIWEMIRRSQAAGIRPVVIMPSGTAGPNQTQNHMIASAVLETPPLDATYQASATEIGDEEWVGNRRHKYTGKPLQVGASTVWATGPAPADKWENPATTVLASLQRLALSRTTYVTDATNFRHQAYGDTTADTATMDTDGGQPRLTVTWDTADNGRGHRIMGDIATTPGHEYLTVVHTRWTGVAPTTALTGISGTNQVLRRGEQDVGLPPGEEFRVMREEAAVPSGAVYIGHGHTASTPATTTVTVLAMSVIDVAALLSDAPNLASMTDRELALFALSLR